MIRALLFLLLLMSHALADGFALGGGIGGNISAAGGAGGGGPVQTYSFLGPIASFTGNEGSSVSYTRDIGTAAASRAVLIYNGQLPSRPPATVTVAGAAATLIYSFTDAGSHQRGDWYLATVPSGSGVQTIAMTWTGTPFVPYDVYTWVFPLGVSSTTPTATAGVTIASVSQGTGTIASANGNFTFCGVAGNSTFSAYWNPSSPAPWLGQRTARNVAAEGLSSAAADWTMNGASLTYWIQTTGAGVNGGISCVNLAATGSHSAPPAACVPGSCTYGTSVFNCPTFTTTGACGVNTPASSTGIQPFLVYGTTGGSTPAISGTQVLLMPNACNHCGLNLNVTAPVDIRAFRSVVQFIPNGENFYFVVQNNTNSNNDNTSIGPQFFSGASCEGSFFQGAVASSSPAPPNLVFAGGFDQNAPLQQTFSTGATAGFTYSGAQIYRPDTTPAGSDNNGGGGNGNSTTPPGQNPCQLTASEIGSSPVNYSPVVNLTKISTSPVPLNSPAGTVETTTGHVYSATFTYDGSTFTIDLFDVTASGTCTPVTSGSCFHQTWSGINIPQIVGGGPLAWVGFAGSSPSSNSLNPLYVNSWNYSVPP